MGMKLDFCHTSPGIFIGGWGVEPKVSPTGKSSSEFDVFALLRFKYASRDVRDVRGVPCVRRRAHPTDQ